MYPIPSPAVLVMTTAAAVPAPLAWTVSCTVVVRLFDPAVYIATAWPLASVEPLTTVGADAPLGLTGIVKATPAPLTGLRLPSVTVAVMIVLPPAFKDSSLAFMDMMFPEAEPAVLLMVVALVYVPQVATILSSSSAVDWLFPAV